MLSSEEVLAQAAQDGSIDSLQWPSVLKAVLERLDYNVFNQFAIPADAMSSAALLSQPEPATTVPNTQRSTTPSKTQDLPPPSSPPEAGSGSPVSLESTPHPLPGPLATTFNFVRKSLAHNFAEYPPHTIQRLSELLLWPKQHHAYLHSYLNALDRVVAVSSGTNVFPLPTIESTSTTGPTNMVNGGSVGSASTLHGDESLGGALLTPISWLKDRDTPSEGTPSPTTSRAQGSFGSPKDEDGNADATPVGADDDKGVTQGELLRREQEISNPPAPVTSAASAGSALSKGYSGSILGPPAGEASEGKERGESIGDTKGEETQDHEQPYARGPEQIGMTDTGPQEHVPGMGQVLDMEAAVGRSSHGQRTSLSPEVKMREADDAEAEQSTGDASQDSHRGDGDIELADADGLTDEDQKGKALTGDGTAPHAIDTTSR